MSTVSCVATDSTGTSSASHGLCQPFDQLTIDPASGGVTTPVSVGVTTPASVATTPASVGVTTPASVCVTAPATAGAEPDTTEKLSARIAFAFTRTVCATVIDVQVCAQPSMCTQACVLKRVYSSVCSTKRAYSSV